MAYVLADSGAKLLVASPEHRELARAALADLPGLTAYLWTGSDERMGDWSAAQAGRPTTPIPDESAGIDLLYSSGTTGRPKGVMPTLPTGPIGAETFRYLNDEAKTAAAHNDLGWATLGDIGRLDEEGYLLLSDRRSFMIISGGVNVYPQEIENVLVTHPAVADVAVIGLPCEEMGEMVVAVVQPSPGVEPDARLAEELRAFARRELGGVKTPRRIDFAAELPREPTGKLFKRKLKERYAE